jgi:MFS family permease
VAKARAATAPLIFLLGAAVFLNYVDRGAVGIAAPLLKSDLHLSAKAYGVAFSAFFWVYAPIQLFAGWLCDRFSVYRLMALGILLWAGSTFLTGFAGGFASLLVLRVMLGIGESISFPGSSKIIARHPKEAMISAESPTQRLPPESRLAPQSVRSRAG